MVTRGGQLEERNRQLRREVARLGEERRHLVRYRAHRHQNYSVIIPVTVQDVGLAEGGGAAAAPLLLASPPPPTLPSLPLPLLPPLLGHTKLPHRPTARSDSNT